jgi:Fe-S-cluster containining protein
VPLQDCIFLEGGTACRVYDARPLQCSTYPWWPELMDPAAWQQEKLSTCEGLDHDEAAALDVLHAAAQLKAATEHFAERDAAATAPKRRH